MKKITLILSALFVSAVGFAQTLGTAELKELKDSFNKDATAKEKQKTVISNLNLKTLSYNAEAAKNNDNFFKYRTDVKGITNQRSSGRCWMYTSMNNLRPIVMKKYNLDEFDFSHNFNYFYDLLEKANLFLENVIRTSNKNFTDEEVVFYFKSPVGDGGVWNLFYNIAEKYGVVPEIVMPETDHSNNTSQLLSVLNERLRKGGYDIRAAYDKSLTETSSGLSGDIGHIQKEIKKSTLKDVYKLLAMCLGEPPTEFTWRFTDKNGKDQIVKSTPKEFYKNIVPKDYSPSNYIMIMNDPTREYYKVYEIANYRNTIEGINWVYLNLPNDVIKAAALASIKDGETMYASCDVGKQSNTKAGVGFMDDGLYNYGEFLGIDLKMDKKARILTRQSGSSHAMLIVAVDTDANDKPTKWLFENSWGPDRGYKGYLTFTDKWFDEYMFRIVIHKKYLDSKSLKASSQKPIMLPANDYMF